MPEPHQRESDLSIDSSPPVSGLDRLLSKKKRLTRTDLFSETFAQNRKRVGRFMVLWVRTGEGAALRLGVVTSKKVHLRANRRNLARRRLREAYRHLRPYFSGEFDVILVGRRAILDAEWKLILLEMLDLARKAGIISNESLTQARQKYELDTSD
jgi:ribonuclease P protein component